MLLNHVRFRGECERTTSIASRARAQSHDADVLDSNAGFFQLYKAKHLAEALVQGCNFDFMQSAFIFEIHVTWSSKVNSDCSRQGSRTTF